MRLSFPAHSAENRRHVMLSDHRIFHVCFMFAFLIYFIIVHLFSASWRETTWWKQSSRMQRCAEEPRSVWNNVKNTLQLSNLGRKQIAFGLSNLLPSFFCNTRHLPKGWIKQETPFTNLYLLRNFKRHTIMTIITGFWWSETRDLRCQARDTCQPFCSRLLNV